MDRWHIVVNWITGALSAATLLGLAWRSRARRSYAFVAYLALVAGQSVRLALMTQPVSWSTWLAIELLLRFVCVAVAVEIALRIVVAVPRARSAVARAGLLIGAATVTLFFLDVPTAPNPVFEQASPADVAAFEAAQQWLPRLAYGSAWLFAVFFAAITGAALPLDPLHRAALAGFAFYLILYAVTMGALHADESYAGVARAVQSLAFIAVLGVWCYMAWRREYAPLAAADVVERLQPWR